ncbi:MAG: hypothetical protein H0W61_01330 [Bacteroidetes bacterium]|nr:hypothetical protein [Bacteroidota bacterium]
MKTVLSFLIFLAFSFQLSAQEKPVTQTMTIEGLYQGKNIFVKNPYGPDGIGFCVTGVKVNGQITTDKINADIFQVDLSLFKLKVHENVKIEMYYKTGSKLTIPTLINPGALINPKSIVKNEETSLSIEGVFRWQNVFICNPMLPNGKGCSVSEVLVNGTPITTNISSDIFEIDLIDLGLINSDKKLKDGDKIIIEFKYKVGYDPIILNPDVLK